MNLSKNKERKAERGGAGVKLMLVAIVIILVAHAGYNFVPVAFQAEDFKQEMETAVVQGVSLPSTYGAPTEAVRFKLNNAARASQLPSDTLIEVKEKNNIVTARVFYSKKVQLVPFGLYEYDYVFDHSATPSGFLSQ